MNDICPVCGCKTEAFDFVKVDTPSGAAMSVCGYCGKQLGALTAAEDDGSEGFDRVLPKVRWLDAVLEKEVAGRSDEYSEILKELRGRFPEAVVPTVTEGAPEPSVAVLTSSDSGKLKELDARLEKLEKSFYKLKRGLLITSVAEIVLPAILLMILAMIFFKSDLWVNLSKLIYSATGGYNMFRGF